MEGPHFKKLKRKTGSEDLPTVVHGWWSRSRLGRGQVCSLCLWGHLRCYHLAPPWWLLQSPIPGRATPPQSSLLPPNLPHICPSLQVPYLCQTSLTSEFRAGLLKSPCPSISRSRLKCHLPRMASSPPAPALVFFASYPCDHAPG